jgi:hypothetical protein
MSPLVAYFLRKKGLQQGQQLVGPPATQDQALYVLETSMVDLIHWGVFSNLIDRGRGQEASCSCYLDRIDAQITAGIGKEDFRLVV